jgi:trehalose-6-phosphate synthase
MNLVAKEYCMTRIHRDGALILSEFAGAALEMKQAIQVNPFDVDGIAELDGGQPWRWTGRSRGGA